jgi:hypothetical protein
MLNVAWGGWLGEAPAVTLKRDIGLDCRNNNRQADH